LIPGISAEQVKQPLLHTRYQKSLLYQSRRDTQYQKSLLYQTPRDTRYLFFSKRAASYDSESHPRDLLYTAEDTHRTNCYINHEDHNNFSGEHEITMQMFSLGVILGLYTNLREGLR
jgi:hypothetical protein